MDHAAAALSHHRIAVLTGAGVSTRSGIPDYRGPDAPPRQPMTFAQFCSSAAARQRYWARSFIGWRRIDKAKPNEGHTALARLEHGGKLTGIVTQNVDGLHQAAGSEAVIDLHGRLDRVACLSCQTITPRSELDVRMAELNPEFAQRWHGIATQLAPDGDAELVESTDDYRVPECLVCGGILKPDVVFFGETVPPEHVAAAYSITDAADALVVAGSSLTVYSGLRFVRKASAQSKPIVVINRGPTRGDSLATVVINADTSVALPGLVEGLLNP